MAEVARVAGYEDLNMIDDYAHHFGLDPDVVYSSTDFDTFMAFIVKWKLQREFQQKFDDAKKLLTPTT